MKSIALAVMMVLVVPLGLGARLRPTFGLALYEIAYDPSVPLRNASYDPTFRGWNEASLGVGYFFQEEEFGEDSDRLLLLEGLLALGSQPNTKDAWSLQSGVRLGVPVGEEFWGLGVSYLALKPTYNLAFGEGTNFFQLDLELTLRFVLYWSPMTVGLGWQPPTNNNNSSWHFRFGFLRFLIPLGA